MKTSSRGTTAEDAGRTRAKTQAKDTSAPDGSNVTVPPLEPTPLSECVVSTLAEIIAREHANKES